MTNTSNVTIYLIILKMDTNFAFKILFNKTSLFQQKIGVKLYLRYSNVVRCTNNAVTIVMLI